MSRKTQNEKRRIYESLEGLRSNLTSSCARNKEFLEVFNCGALSIWKLSCNRDILLNRIPLLLICFIIFQSTFATLGENGEIFSTEHLSCLKFSFNTPSFPPQYYCHTPEGAEIIFGKHITQTFNNRASGHISVHWDTKRERLSIEEDPLDSDDLSENKSIILNKKYGVVSLRYRALSPHILTTLPLKLNAENTIWAGTDPFPKANIKLCWQCRIPKGYSICLRGTIDPFKPHRMSVDYIIENHMSLGHESEGLSVLSEPKGLSALLEIITRFPLEYVDPLPLYPRL